MGVGLAIKRSRVPSPTTARLRNDSGQVVHTYLPPRRQSSLPHGVAGQSTFTFLKNQGAHEGRTRVTGNVKGGLETVVFRNLDLVRVADLPGRRRLRSSSSHQLLVPPFRLTTVGRRTFPVAASLPFGTHCQLTSNHPRLCTSSVDILKHSFSSVFS